MEKVAVVSRPRPREAPAVVAEESVSPDRPSASRLPAVSPPARGTAKKERPATAGGVTGEKDRNSRSLDCGPRRSPDLRRGSTDHSLGSVSGDTRRRQRGGALSRSVSGGVDRDITPRLEGSLTSSPVPFHHSAAHLAQQNFCPDFPELHPPKSSQLLQQVFKSSIRSRSGSCPNVGPQMVALQATEGRRPSTGFGIETTLRLERERSESLGRSTCSISGSLGSCVPPRLPLAPSPLQSPVPACERELVSGGMGIRRWLASAGSEL